jgi:hypothetical protein
MKNYLNELNKSPNVGVTLAITAVCGARATAGRTFENKPKPQYDLSVGQLSTITRPAFTSPGKRANTSASSLHQCSEF